MAPIDREQTLLLLFTKEWRLTVSDLLLSLMTKEGQKQFALFQKRIALSLTKNEWFTWKTDEQILNPALKGPCHEKYNTLKNST